MNNPLITIVVPVFNTSKYLNRCLESIVHQTYKNIEIILINDGSTDCSPLLCDYWAQRDPRISVIHQNNQGLGMARNTGIENAKGLYISFMDSDDFIDLDMYQLLIDNLQKVDADTSYCSIKQYVNNTKQIIPRPISKAGIYTGLEILYDIIGADPEFQEDYKREMSVCAALFSLQIIRSNNIRFFSEREYICEDLIFDFQYLKFAKTIVTAHEAKYYYCINEQSLTHIYNPGRFNKNITLYNKVIDLLDSVFPDYKPARVRFYKLFLGMTRACIVQEVRCVDYPFGTKLKRLREITGNATIQRILNEYPYHLNPIKQKIFNTLLKNRQVIPLYVISLLR